MNLNSRKLSVVRLHESYHINGIGSLGPVVQSDGQLKVDMTKLDGGVHILAIKNGIRGECFIPDANCKGMTLITQENVIPLTSA